ncbi:MAG: GlsB/YeaQ/YmgE family stress response membrane protein [Lachnospiraceae bacterium]|nr:GlsB/YeaQ/YmgE family stress response membrane protein [Lachnospiraceae bacterium]
MISLIIDIIIAGIAGCIAGELMGSKGSRLYNVILGIVGGSVGGVIFRLIGFSASNRIGGLVVSVVGACLVIYMVRVIKK